MIKNYHMVREAEMDYQSHQKLSIEKSFEILEDMYLFSRNFEKEDTPAEKSPHVQMLIKLADTFKRIGKIKNA